MSKAIISRVIAAIFAMAAVVFFMDSISAATIQIAGRHSSNEIKNKCDAAGGVFNSNSAGYTCAGPGGTVFCGKSGKCLGECPNCGAARTTPGSVAGVLQPSRGGVKTEGNPPPKDKGGLKPVSSGGSKQTGGGNKPIERPGGWGSSGGSKH